MTDRERQYKAQARHMARQLEGAFTEGAALDALRCGGDALCPLCQLPYYEHPQLGRGPAAGLTVTCDGLLVKL